MRLTVVAFLAGLLVASSGAFAKPVRSGTEPGVLETLTGHVDVVNQGRTLVMKLKLDAGAGDRWFRVETDSLLPLPASFSADAAEILYWQGHLLLRMPAERKAFLVSMPGYRPAPVPPAAAAGLGPVRTDASLDAFLAGYDVTRIDSATEIASSQGPRARVSIGIDREGREPENKSFTPPPNPGSGGVGTCGNSCSITCGDFSTCTANCTTPRCASCSCPASCTCS
jgi:hypothetical protein